MTCETALDMACRMIARYAPLEKAEQIIADIRRQASTVADYYVRYECLDCGKLLTGESYAEHDGSHSIRTLKIQK